MPVLLLGETYRLRVRGYELDFRFLQVSAEGAERIRRDPASARDAIARQLPERGADAVPDFNEVIFVDEETKKFYSLLQIVRCFHDDAPEFDSPEFKRAVTEAAFEEFERQDAQRPSG